MSDTALHAPLVVFDVVDPTEVVDATLERLTRDDVDGTGCPGAASAVVVVVVVAGSVLRASGSDCTPSNGGSTQCAPMSLLQLLRRRARAAVPAAVHGCGGGGDAGEVRSGIAAVTGSVAVTGSAAGTDAAATVASTRPTAIRFQKKHGGHVFTHGQRLFRCDNGCQHRG